MEMTTETVKIIFGMIYILILCLAGLIGYCRGNESAERLKKIHKYIGGKK